MRGTSLGEQAVSKGAARLVAIAPFAQVAEELAEQAVARWQAVRCASAR